MSLEINLLPWRAQKREQEKRAWIIALLLALGIGYGVVFSINYYVGVLIYHQELRNDRLQDEIVLSRRKIQKINSLNGLRQSLLSRIQRMKKFQLERILIVHFFDELVKIVPDEVSLRQAERIGEQVKVVGSAKSNKAISRMMHNIQRNRWLRRPVLTEIKKNKGSDRVVLNEFKLSFALQETT